MPNEQINIEQIDEGFVDAISVWSNYIQTGKWGWGPSAAEAYFIGRNELNFNNPPNRIATAEELQAFKDIAKFNETWKKNPSSISARDVQQIEPKIRSAETYINDSLGISLNQAGLEAGQPQAVPQYDVISDIVAKAKQIYTNPPPPENEYEELLLRPENPYGELTIIPSNYEEPQDPFRNSGGDGQSIAKGDANNQEDEGIVANGESEDEDASDVAKSTSEIPIE